ncbi:hypothetical protein BDV19DRAFT_389720 [Aspergillus venezuelensis]
MAGYVNLHAGVGKPVWEIAITEEEFSIWFKTDPISMSVLAPPHCDEYGTIFRIPLQVRPPVTLIIGASLPALLQLGMRIRNCRARLRTVAAGSHGMGPLDSPRATTKKGEMGSEAGKSVSNSPSTSFQAEGDKVDGGAGGGNEEREG